MKKLITLTALLIVSCFSLPAQNQGQSQNAENEITVEKRKRLNAVKMQFLSPLSGHLTFGYERSIGKGMSSETKVGFAGIGVNRGLLNLGMQKKVSGITLRQGCRFKLRPDYVVPGMKQRSVLSGGYVKPELAFSAFSQKSSYETYDYNTNTYVTHEQEDKVRTFALLFGFGKQWVLESGFVVDISYSIGYGISTHDFSSGLESGNMVAPNRYGFSFYDKSFPIATSSSLCIGFAF